ncbi:MarR family winged helix-turn-helix transcriptional regulator [Jatrophihabitans sp. DSM 45814]
MTRFAGGPADSPGFLLWHTTLLWQRTITAALQPLDLTHVQFVLLACAWWLESRGDTPNQQDLARQAGTDVKMTSQVLRKLEAKGLLERAIAPSDNRARHLHVTEEGADLARSAIVVVETADAEVFGAEAPALVAILQRIAGTSR